MKLPGQGSNARTCLSSSPVENDQFISPSAAVYRRVDEASDSLCWRSVIFPFSNRGRVSVSNSAPSSNNLLVSSPAVSPHKTFVFRCATIGPVSIPSSSLITVTPVIASPCKTVVITGDGPLYLGKRDGCILIAPSGAISNSSVGIFLPKAATTMAVGPSNSRSSATPSAARLFG